MIKPYKMTPTLERTLISLGDKRLNAKTFLWFELFRALEVISQQLYEAEKNETL
jgi:hypothetical protein